MKIILGIEILLLMLWIQVRINNKLSFMICFKIIVNALLK